jgi:hypothetical protein
MAVLDCADPSMSVDKRNETLNPLQALALMNNKLAVAMAQHFAARLEREEKMVEAQIGRGIKLALGREGTEQEKSELVDMAKHYGLAAACRVMLNLNEFVFVD